jgi:cell division protein FtsI (penicillin-binding protein 3)
MQGADVKARSQPSNLRARLYTVLMVLVLASTALVVRAVDLQVVRKDFYQGEGDARYLRDIPIAVSRGTIFDRNGEPLAVSTPVESIWGNPQELLANPEKLPVLAKALDVTTDALTERLVQRKDKEFLYLKRPVDPDAAKDILALQIPGVASERAFRRYYPSGEIMAHTLGITNIDDRGQEGLELAFDDWLAGKPGVKRVIRDRLGHVVENVELLREAQAGRDLTLSIDRRIQYLAYRELKAAILEHHASSGSMVILDVSNGEVLAMVNQPSFNPNSRINIEPSYRRNRGVTDVVEPGSTMKPFTIAAALESGRWKADTPIDTNPGRLQLAGGYTINDIHNYGMINVTRVITKSSNVGAAKIAQSMTSDHMYDVFKRFGFGEVSGCGFPGESPGFLPIAKAWGPVEKATMSYGYGLNVTPMQIAQAYSVLANRGRLRQPGFVKGAMNPDSAVIDPQIAEQVLAMLETVISPTEGGRRAAVLNYRVAGKTGTSRRAVAGSYEKRYVSLFAGIVPASNPRLVGVVVIHDPGGGQGAYYGGLIAAPVFSKVMDGALRLLDVSPDNVQRWYAGSPEMGRTVDPASPPSDTPDDMAKYEESIPQ